jgi:hypothetical protein
MKGKRAIESLAARPAVLPEGRPWTHAGILEIAYELRIRGLSRLATIPVVVGRPELRR